MILVHSDQSSAGLIQYSEATNDRLNIYPVIGITVSIVGNVLINVALNIQRYAHRKLVDRGGTHYLKDELWWVGAIIMTIGETGNFLAYGFAPASIVSPLGVFSMVSNCIIAPVFFGESIKRKNILGVVVAIVGIVLIIFSAQPGEDPPPLDPYKMVKGIMDETPFRLYTLVACLVALPLALLSSTTYDHSHAIAALFCNISLVALLGAYTALATKCLSSLLSFAFLCSFRHSLTYVLIFIVGSTAVLQVVYLNRALQNFKATLVVPLHFVFFTMSVILASGIVFRDFEGRDSDHLLAFFVGCVLTFIGVALIALSGSSESPGQYTEVGDEEESIVPILSTPARPVVNPIWTTRANVASSSLGAIDECFDPVITHYGREQPHARGIAHIPTNRIVSSLPITNSGFFIGTVLENRRSMSTLHDQRINGTADENEPLI